MSTAGERRPYTLRITRPAARALAERLPEKVATAAHEFITTTLLDNPHRVGKRLLLSPFQETWSARRGTYRILYEIDDERLVVTVTAVGIRRLEELEQAAADLRDLALVLARSAADSGRRTSFDEVLTAFGQDRASLAELPEDE